MKFLSSVKMKYKLLGTALLPSLILLCFLAKFLYEDYQSIHKMDNTIKVNQISSLLSSFLQNFMESTKDAPALNIDLNKTRNFKDTQETLNALKDYYSRHEIPIDKDSLREDLIKIFSKADALVNLSKTQNILESDELVKDFNELLDLITDFIGDIARYLESSRALFAYVTLLHEQGAAWNEKLLVYKILKAQSLSQNELIKEVELINTQQTFFHSFSQISTEHEDVIYADIVKGPNLSVIENTRKDILKNILTNIKPEVWWEAKSDQISLLTAVSSKILQENIETSEKLKNEHIRSLIIDLLTILAVFFVTVLLTVINLRKLTEHLQNQIEVLAKSNQEILSSITEASSSSAETAAAVSETTTTVEELKQTAQIAAEKAKNVAALSTEAKKTLRDNEKLIDDTIESMKNIQDGMGIISDSIIKLSTNGKTIGDIIDSVNDLAEQSHLLAVNAAIEAAKAGEQGKGFGVVAAEVRRLAEQSKAATIQVRNILRDIQNSTGTAVMATEQGSKAVANGTNQSKQTVNALKNLSHEITKVSDSAEQIALSSAQQLIGVDQVTIAMGNIKESSNLLVETIHHIEGAVQDSNKVSQNLKSLVQEYKL